MRSMVSPLDERVAHVHPQAEPAAVELGRAYADEFDGQRVDAGVQRRLLGLFAEREGGLVRVGYR